MHPPRATVAPPEAGFLRYLRAERPWHWLRDLAGCWASWDAFADHHGLDPDEPTDEALAAYVIARTRAGAGWSTIDQTLRAVRLAVEGTTTLQDGSVTLPAVRLLADLHRSGAFGPSWQAPVVTVGQVLALVEAGTPMEAFLAAGTYLGGLRPGEWSPIDRRHLQVGPKGVLLMLPRAKTGTWQKVTIRPLPGLSLNPAPLAEAFLAQRGDREGPLVADPDGYRLAPEVFGDRLQSLARRAGVHPFTPYSLRRSLAVHADLLGIPGSTIRQRLRHSPHTQTYRRYIEPLLALIDRERAQGHYLSMDRTPKGPAPILRAAPRTPYVRNYAFAAGTIPDLLEGVRMADLRVPRALAYISRDGIESGQRVLQRWADFAQAHGWDPLEPPAHAVPRWLLARLDEVKAVSASADLASLRIGWLDATGHDRIPGWETARSVVAGAVRVETGHELPEHISRLAQPEDLHAVCTAAADAVPEPTRAWAAAVLAWQCKADMSIEVLTVTDAVAVVRIDGGRTRQLQAAEAILVDPVTAAHLLGEGTRVAVRGPATLDKVYSSGASRSRALRDRLAHVLLTGSGARPSDLARAHRTGVEVAPGGLAIILGVAKSKAMRPLGRTRLIWAPTREGDADPLTAWNDWASWWPASNDGPLLPGSVTTPECSSSWSAAAISSAISKTARRCGLPPGLTAYGFRYARATEMHQAGETEETIAEALGHDDLNVTRGYIADFDPFADGLDAELLRALT